MVQFMQDFLKLTNAIRVFSKCVLKNASRHCACVDIAIEVNFASGLRLLTGRCICKTMP